MASLKHRCFSPALLLAAFLFLAKAVITQAAPNPPSHFRAATTAINGTNATVFVIWDDNSTNEGTFRFNYATIIGTEVSAKPSVLLSTDSVSTGTYSFGLHQLNPPRYLATGVTHSFGVRSKTGFDTNVQSDESAYANDIIIKPEMFGSPTSLYATAQTNGSVFLTWVDNAATEDGYLIDVKTGSGPFTAVAATSLNQSGFSVGGLTPSTSYQFQVRGYKGDPNNPTSTTISPSNSASATTPVLAAPTGLSVTPSTTSPSTVSFAWADNSAAEEGYELQYRRLGETTYVSQYATANTTSVPNLQGFTAGTKYEFRVRAYNGSAVSNFAPVTGVVSATTKDGFTSATSAPASVGATFNYQLATNGQSPRSAWSTGTLPSGLSFNSTTGVISGTPTVAGVFTIPLTATFANGGSHTINLVLRFVRPPAAPQIAAAIGPQMLTQGNSVAVALDGKFSDPDTESALRMATTQGPLDFVLYSTATPQTVSNFLGYVNRGDYNNTFFHRAPLGFVVQGGGYKAFAAPDVFEHIATQPAVVNEPGLANELGTLAMAKIGGDPNSATSEFFFSLGDNRLNLDVQNGGFTVFGRATTPALNGILTGPTGLANKPIANYNVKLRSGGVTPASANFTLSDVPVDQPPAPAPIDQNRLIKVTGFTTLPILSFAVTGNSNPSVASAALVGTTLQIQALAPGATNLTVTATDVDGNTVPQVFAVNVQQTFAQWAAAQGLPAGDAEPGDNVDGDSFDNRLEWALFGNPTVADSAEKQPALSTATVGNAKFGEITFPVRKSTSGLIYTVEVSETLLPGSWATLWTSTQGFAAPAVSATLDQPDRTIVTVRDTVPNAVHRFFRVRAD